MKQKNTTLYSTFNKFAKNGIKLVKTDQNKQLHIPFLANLPKME